MTQAGDLAQEATAGSTCAPQPRKSSRGVLKGSCWAGLSVVIFAGWFYTLLPIYIVGGLSRLGLASPSEIGLQAIYQGVLMSGVAIVSFNRSVALLGPSAATAIIALVPVVASLAAVPVLGELPSRAECVALVAVVGGVLLAARPARKATKPPMSMTTMNSP